MMSWVDTLAYTLKYALHTFFSVKDIHCILHIQFKR